MALALQVESLLLKARQTPQEEIDALCTAIGSLLSLPDKSSECCVFLRQLFFILQTSRPDAEPFIASDLMRSMIQVAASGNQPSKLSLPGSISKCSLCQMILAELFPHDERNDLLGQSVDGKDSNAGVKLIDLMLGKKTKCIDQMIPDITRWLQSQDLEKQMSGLAVLTSLNMLHSDILNPGQVNTTTDRMAQWLGSAGLLQAPNPYAVNPFRKDEDSTVTEIDGSTNVNIFTALNIGQYYTDDQFMNIFSFSVLYKWLRTFKDKASAEQASDASNVNKERAKYPSEKALGSLVPKSVEYCFRVIEQCERKVKVQSDAEFQIACLLEAVQVLDTICFLDENQIARVFQEVKRLNVRLMEDSSLSAVLVPVLRFFFHHSNFVVHDPQHTFHHFFSVLVSEQFKDQGLMYDIIDFLYSHQEEVLNTTDIFSKYFPNLFKILAWYPRVFLNEFCQLLPSMINWTTAVEIFHLLLDLPCVCAALEVVEKARKYESSTIPMEVEPTTSLEAFNSPRYRPLFSYIIRGESGQGDTIDRLSNLHAVLQDCTQSKRVLVCCQIVPILLKIWFDTVLESEDPDFMSNLIPVILERSGLLFDIPEYVQDIQTVMSEKILVMCKEYPEIVTKEREEISDFLVATSNLKGRVSIYNNLIYVVGEYSSTTHCSECTSDVIGKYYESLEVMTYELLAQLSAPDQNASLPKIISALISTLAKLASRCQDLIPRAILSLTKVAKHRGSITLPALATDTLIHRATALIAVLKNPESAGRVLNPSIDIYTAKWHLNNTSQAAILRSMHRLIKE